MLKGNGDYMWSLGLSKELGLNDLGETVRLVLGRHDVPVAVEMAIAGMKQGTVRTVEMPPQLGFSTAKSDSMLPSTFSGKQRYQRYQGIVTGTGGVPGYEAVLNVEIEVVRVRRRGEAGAAS